MMRGAGRVGPAPLADTDDGIHVDIFEETVTPAVVGLEDDHNAAAGEGDGFARSAVPALPLVVALPNALDGERVIAALGKSAGDAPSNLNNNSTLMRPRASST